MTGWPAHVQVHNNDWVIEIAADCDTAIEAQSGFIGRGVNPLFVATLDTPEAPDLRPRGMGAGRSAPLACVARKEGGGSAPAPVAFFRLGQLQYGLASRARYGL